MALTDTYYSAFFKDYEGNTWSVYVKGPSYSGASTEVQMGPDPCVIRWMSEGDEKYATIKAAECNIELISSTSLQYLALFTAPVKTYWVEVYQGVVHGDNMKFKGWINPEYYSEPFLPPPYITKISCTDGIGLLKNIPFPRPTSFKNSLMYYIHTALEQIGLDLNIESTTNWSINSASGSVTARSLEYIYIDYRSMRDGNDMWDCYTVLDEILKTLNARLYQNKAHWYLERIDPKYANHRLERYDKDGVYLSTTAANDEVETLTTSSASPLLRFMNADAELGVELAYKSISLHQEYGNRTNLLPFNNWAGLFYADEWSTGTDPTHWNRHYTNPYEFFIDRDEETNSMRIYPFTENASQYAYTDTVDFTTEGAGDLDNLMTAWADGKLSLRFSYSTYGKYTAWKDNTQLISNVKLKMSFSGTEYYLDESGNLQPIAGLDTLSDTLVKGQWTDVDIVIGKPPDEEIGNPQTSITAIVIIQPAANSSWGAGTEDETDGILYKNMQLYFFEPKVDVYDRSWTTVISDDNIIEPEPYETKFMETPSPIYPSTWDAVESCGLVNRYVLFDSVGNVIQYWSIYPTPPGSEIGMIIRSNLLSSYRQPMFKLRGTVFDQGSVMSFSSVLKDYSSYYYCPIGMEFDAKRMSWAGEWLAFYPSTLQGDYNIDFNSDFFID